MSKESLVLLTVSVRKLVNEDMYESSVFSSAIDCSSDKCAISKAPLEGVLLFERLISGISLTEDGWEMMGGVPGLEVRPDDTDCDAASMPFAVTFFKIVATISSLQR